MREKMANNLSDVIIQSLASYINTLIASLSPTKVIKPRAITWLTFYI